MTDFTISDIHARVVQFVTRMRMPPTVAHGYDWPAIDEWLRKGGSSLAEFGAAFGGGTKAETITGHFDPADVRAGASVPNDGTWQGTWKTLAASGQVVHSVTLTVPDPALDPVPAVDWGKVHVYSPNSARVVEYPTSREYRLDNYERSASSNGFLLTLLSGADPGVRPGDWVNWGGLQLKAVLASYPVHDDRPGRAIDGFKPGKLWVIECQAMDF